MTEKKDFSILGLQPGHFRIRYDEKQDAGARSTRPTQMLRARVAG